MIAIDRLDTRVSLVRNEIGCSICRDKIIRIVKSLSDQ